MPVVITWPLSSDHGPSVGTSPGVITTTTLTTRIASVTTDELYRSIIKSIRNIDALEGRLFIKRYLTGPEWWLQNIRAFILNVLPTIDDPTQCPAEALQHLKGLVGLTKEVDFITRDRTIRDLRRLILLALPMWKERGLPVGIVSMIRLLTGRAAQYESWFDQIAILDEALIGEEELGQDLMAAAGQDPDDWSGEYSSMIRLMDDGTLDEDMLVELLKFQRADGETFEVVLLDFYDRFDGPISRTRWQTQAGTPGVVDEDDLNFQLDPGTEEAAVIPIAPSASFNTFSSVLKFNLPTEGDIFAERFFRDDSGQYYDLAITASATPALSVWSLKRHLTSGTSTLYSSETPIQVYPGVDYVLRVQCIRSGSTNYIKAQLDSNWGIEFSDVVAEPAYGKISLRCDGTSAAPVLIDNVEVSRVPGRLGIIGPLGVTLTDNFEQ